MTSVRDVRNFVASIVQELSWTKFRFTSEVTCLLVVSIAAVSCFAVVAEISHNTKEEHFERNTQCAKPMSQENEVTNFQRTTRKEKLGHIFEEMLGEQQKAVQEQNDLFAHQQETGAKQRALRKEQHDIQTEMLRQQHDTKMPCSPEMARSTVILQEQSSLGDLQQEFVVKSNQILHEIQDIQQKLDLIKNEMKQLTISVARNYSNNDTQKSK